MDYIWIERYCIDQNDPEDKVRQILQMGAMYSSTQLTIVAASGSGPQHDLPGISHFTRTPMPYGEVVGSVALVVTSIQAVREILSLSGRQGRGREYGLIVTIQHEVFADTVLCSLRASRKDSYHDVDCSSPIILCSTFVVMD